VDNGSTDGTSEMIELLFPEVKFIAYKTNIGIAARNFLFQNAQGKYLFSFDDDSFPAAPLTLLKAVQFLEKNSHLATLCLQCYQPRSNFCETKYAEKHALNVPDIGVYEGLYVIEGAICFRTDILKKIDGYDPEFFWGAEGFDLSLTLYRNGYIGAYYPALLCLHMRSPINRNINTNIYRLTRNYFWSFVKHFPLWSLPILLIPYILRKILLSLQSPQQSKDILRGVFDGIRGYSLQRKKSSKLSWRQVVRLKRWYIYLYRW
jgi:GT2 family glycosyltransferase